MFRILWLDCQCMCEEKYVPKELNRSQSHTKESQRTAQYTGPKNCDITLHVRCSELCSNETQLAVSDTQTCVLQAGLLQPRASLHHTIQEGKTHLAPLLVLKKEDRKRKRRESLFLLFVQRGLAQARSNRFYFKRPRTVRQAQTDSFSLAVFRRTPFDWIRSSPVPDPILCSDRSGLSSK